METAERLSQEMEDISTSQQKMMKLEEELAQTLAGYGKEHCLTLEQQLAMLQADKGAREWKVVEETEQCTVGT